MQSLNQFAAKQPKSAVEHICYSDTDGALAPLVSESVRLSAQIEELTGELKDHESFIKERGLKWFFETHHGKSDIPTSIKVKGANGDAVLLQVTSKYGQITIDSKNADKIAAIKKTLGSSYNAHVETKFSLSIDGSNIPEENREAFVNALATISKVFCHAPVPKEEQDEFIDNLNATVDMGFDHSNGEQTTAITAKQTIAPIESFHKSRHVLLSPCKNLRLQEIMPCTVSLKKKGVK